MKAIERLFVFFEAKGIKHTPIERELGFTNGYLGKMRDRKGSIGSDLLENIFSFFPDLNPDWLIMGNGSMLRSEQEQSAPSLVAQPIAQSDQSSEAMMHMINTIASQAELIGQLKNEKEVLQSRIQQLEPDVIKPKREDITEAFTEDLSESYGKSSLPTTIPSTSRSLSVGKT